MQGANILELILAGAILGVFGGLLGSFFIAVNTWANKIRKIVLTKNWYKPIETAAFCFLSATVFYGAFIRPKYKIGAMRRPKNNWKAKVRVRNF